MDRARHIMAQVGEAAPAPVTKRAQRLPALVVAMLAMLVGLGVLINDFVPRRATLANSAYAAASATLAQGSAGGAVAGIPTQPATTGSIPGGERDRPHGRPIDLSRSDWLITQNWQQHRQNEKLADGSPGLGALDFAFVGNKNAFGSPIHATESGIAGTLADRGDGTGYGNAVYILGYIDLATGESYNTVYGHFQRVYTRPGQTVNAGDVLGQMGSTGWSSGPHVHYEVWRCQRPADVVKQGITPGTVNPSLTECTNIDPADFIN